MINAVVFDIGGVLEIVDDATWPERWRRRWQAIGAANRHSAGAGREGSDETSSESATAVGEPTESQVRAMYRSRFGLTEPQADDMMADLWDSYCGRLDVEMRDFAAGLRPRYRTAILSNSGDGARREEQRRYDFAGLVDTIVYSHEVGVAKPDRAIFELTASRLNADPDEILFLDDSAAAVDGARDAGWHAIRHVDTARSIAQLTAILDRPSLA
jgi:HAD superfamily hydrolase (TIGR01509 family)